MARGAASQLVDETTEQTPLLTDTPSTSSTTLDRTPSPRPALKPDNVPNYRVGWARGISISSSLFILIFLQTSNMSGMTLIQGDVSEDFGAFDSAMWITTAFFIPTSSLSPLWGRLGTLVPVRLLVPPMAILMAGGSLVSSQATSFPIFVVGRVLSGMAGAGVLAMSMIIIIELTSKRRRGFFIGLVNMGFTTGVAVGAVVYGALLPIIGWRPLFWIQTPVSLAAGLVLFISLPLTKVPSKQPGSVFQRLLRMDYLGALLLTSTIVLFLYGLSGEIQIWPMLASLASLIIFLLFEYYIASDPIIPLKVLGSRTVILSCLAQLGFVSARWSVLFYAPIYILAVRGASAAASGAVIVPTNAAFGLSGLAVGLLHLGRGPLWLPTLAALALFTASLYSLSIVVADPADLSIAALIVAVIVNGIGTGTGFNLTLSHALNLSPRDVEYVTSALLGTFRGFGGSFGSAIGGGYYARSLRTSLVAGFLDLDASGHLSPDREKLVSRLVASPSFVHHGGLPEAEVAVATEAYAAATSDLWRNAALVCIIVMLVQAGTGWKSLRQKDNDAEANDSAPTEQEVIRARANVSEREGVAEA